MSTASDTAEKDAAKAEPVEEPAYVVMRGQGLDLAFGHVPQYATVYRSELADSTERLLRFRHIAPTGQMAVPPERVQQHSTWDAPMRPQAPNVEEQLEELAAIAGPEGPEEEDRLGLILSGAVPAVLRYAQDHPEDVEALSEAEAAGKGRKSLLAGLDSLSAGDDEEDGK